MRAITVVPGTKGSARLDQIEEPPQSEGSVLVETIAVGVCGTDLEIVRGDYGWNPSGRDRLVLGHESLGRVLEAPPDSGFNPGALVVGIVRRPDPEPCYACAAGEWDACRNGRYTEHGIKALDGFMRERYRIPPDALVTIDAELGPRGVLMEPTTIVAKAWEQTMKAGRRAVWEPKTALIVGAGPIGLLAALLGVQQGLEVHVVDRVTDGPKPTLVAKLGATYHSGPIEQALNGADVVIECTGVPTAVLAATNAASIGGVVCLTGISPVGTELSLDLGALARAMVLENKTLLGSVNANRRHYEAAAKALAKADHGFLDGLITRTVPLEAFASAFERHDDDVKVVVATGAPA